MAKDRLQQALKEVMAEYQVKLNDTLKNALLKKKFKASGKTLNSLKILLEQRSGSALTDIVVEFETHSRFHDMRNLRLQGRRIPLKPLTEWVEEIGLEKFKYVPGVKHKPIGEVKNAAQRIAYGIATHKQRLGKHRVRQWYNRNVYKIIFGENGLLEDLTDHLSKEMIETLNQINAQ